MAALASFENRTATPLMMSSQQGVDTVWPLLRALLELAYASTEDVEPTLPVVAPGLGIPDIDNDLRKYLSDTCTQWSQYRLANVPPSEASPVCNQPQAAQLGPRQIRASVQSTRRDKTHSA